MSSNSSRYGRRSFLETKKPLSKVCKVNKDAQLGVHSKIDFQALASKLDVHSKIDFHTLAKKLNQKRENFQHLKKVCEVGKIYIILKAEVKETKFNNILVVTVSPVQNTTQKYVTYFTASILDKFIECFKPLNVDILKTPMVVSGLKFRYSGEEKAAGGYYYSRLHWLDEDENDSDSDDGDSYISAKTV